MSEASRNLEEVRESVLGRFRGRSPLHEFFILDQGDVDFRAYVFLEKNEDVAACRTSGVDREIIDFVYVELERLGRGARNEIKVAFEFDSDENVAANFNGDYYLRRL